jgi:acetyl esterase/lipase
MNQVPPSDIFTRRVCLRLDGMDAVTVRRDVAFGPPDRALRLDLYYPPAEPRGVHLPAVVIVAGYPGTLRPRPTTLAFKQFGWTVSMCELIAASGMVAIAYTNTDPVGDLHALLDHLAESAEAFSIDPARIGAIASSGNVPTALTAIMRDAPRRPACAAFLYGCLLDLDGATDVAEAARQFGFSNGGAGRNMADLRRDVPLLITRAGRDQFPAMNASIDRFIHHALVENLPITLVNHAEGPHAYDLFDDSHASRGVVLETLRFLQHHLTAGDHHSWRGN